MISDDLRISTLYVVKEIEKAIAFQVDFSRKADPLPIIKNSQLSMKNVEVFSFFAHTKIRMDFTKIAKVKRGFLHKMSLCSSKVMFV